MKANSRKFTLLSHFEGHIVSIIDGVMPSRWTNMLSVKSSKIYKKIYQNSDLYGPLRGPQSSSMCQNNLETFLAGGTNAPILTQEAPILAQEPSILEPNPLVLFTLKSSTTEKKFTKKRVLRCLWEGLKVAPMGQNNF